MRIVFATQNYYQVNNGQAAFVRRLADGFGKRGHNVLVATPSDRRESYREERGNLAVYALRSRSLAPFYPDVFVTVRPRHEIDALFDNFQPDVVCIQDHFPLCRATLASVIKRSLPSAGCNHFLPENIIPFVPVLSKFASARALMERIMWRQVLSVFNSLDIAAAPTETAANILRDHGIRPTVRAISCGVDLTQFHPDTSIDRAEIRSLYGLDPSRTLLLFVGRVDREKRLDVLIRAMSRVQTEEIQLAVVGRGRDLETLKELSASLKLGDRVVFTGLVPDGDLQPLLVAADLFAMPSEAELQSIATLESMACGKPVLASDARALPELVQTGVNGYSFRSGDDSDAAAGIDQLMAWRSRWPEFGIASLNKARAHSLPCTIQEYEQLLEDAMEIHNRRT